MSVTELMIDLRERGIQLEARGDRLRYSPKAAMTPELAERVKAHKPTLLAILRCELDHHDRASWNYGPDRYGRAGFRRVTCKGCGRFWGYDRLTPNDNNAIMYIDTQTTLSEEPR